MAALPRVITVDPTGRLSRIVRAAIDLSDLSVVQIDIPGGVEALEELRLTSCTLLVTAYGLDGVDPGLDGFKLAGQVKRDYPLTAVVVLAEAEEDEPELTPDTPFLFLRRPLDSAQIMRIVTAGISYRDIFLAAHQPARRVEIDIEMGAVPPIDPNFVGQVMDKLANDIRPMAILLASRTGEVIFEVGAGGYLDRDALATALVPGVRAAVNMSSLVGTQPATLNFYDGDQFDIFTLSVGFHYVLCIIFDGQGGVRQFGAVNRFGRRAAEDLIAVLGTHAYALDLPTQKEEETPRRRPAIKAVTQEIEVTPVLLERAETWESEPAPPPPEPEPLQLEPIADFDVSILDQNADDLDALLEAADDLFDPEKLAEIADESRRDRGPLTYEEARQLGILP